VVGLSSYRIVIPDRAALGRAAERLAASGVEHEQRDGEVLTHDPAGNRLVLSAS
jgi:hypothetical protein